jgi:hypothetical protein
MVASRGRGGDTMLAHITPKEAKMLRAKGGMGTINPATGLPEYSWLEDRFNDVKGAVKSIGSGIKDAWNGVKNLAKDIVSSPIGRVLATVAIAYFAGPAVLSMTGLSGAAGAAATMATASGAVTALGGGNIRDVLKSAAIGGATAFFGAPGGIVSNFVGGAVTNAAANAAITSGIVGTGMGLLTGQKLQDAVKSGLTAGAISGLSTGVTQGFGSQIKAPEVPSVSEMAKGQAGENVSGKYNPETGKFDLPEVVNRDTIAGQNASGTADLKPIMDPATGGVRTVAADGRTYQVFTRPDGSVVYQPATGTGANAPAFMKGDVIPAANAQGSTPTSMDPLGDFIQKNDAARDLASTPARAPAPAQGYQAPTIGQSFKTMGGGIADIAQGDFSKGFEGVSKGAGDLFFPGSPTNSEVMGSSQYQDLVNKGISPDKALEMASKDLTPGMVRTYAPGIAAGLGVAGLAGAFTPKPPQPTPQEDAMNQRLQAERDRVAANPGNYVPKGLEKYGIVYNDRGEIVGSNPWKPDISSQPTEVAGNYMAYTPSPYMTPSGAIGGTQPLYQPFNTTSMYTNLMPRHAADGGMMAAEPVHMAGGGVFQGVQASINRILAKKQQDDAAAAEEKAQADRVAAIQNSYRPPMQSMQPQVQQPVEVSQYQQPVEVSQYQQPVEVSQYQQPVEVSQYQQPYNPNQVSDLSRKLYPSIYDQSFRDSILSNTAMGQPQGGGIASLATGGYPRRTGPISGPGTGTSDSIPAMLSDGEFVMTAKAVRGAGKGSRLAGAKKMYALMHQLERNAARG